MKFGKIKKVLLERQVKGRGEGGEGKKRDPHTRHSQLVVFRPHMVNNISGGQIKLGQTMVLFFFY